MKAKRFNLRKTLFTKSLAKSVKKKNVLYKCFLNNPNSSNENAYKSFKNKLTHSLRVAKRLYYKKHIEKLKLKILNRNRETRSLPSIFRVILKKFPIQRSKYFSNISPNLASKISVSQKCHNSFLPIKLVNSIFLNAANEQEITEIHVCSTCRSGTAVGYDNISMNLIKESTE